MRPHSLALAALILLLVLPTTAARAIPLSPGQSLALDFGFAAPPQSLAGDVDVLSFEISSLSPSTGLTGIRIELFDGATSLGIQGGDGDIRSFWSWRTAASPWNLMSPEVADLSSVIDGSIVGRILLTPFFDPAVAGAGIDVQFPRIRSGTAADAVQLFMASPDPDVTPQVLPEPAAGLLLLLPLAVARRFRAKGRRRSP